MSNKVFGFCEAGCRYRVALYDEFEKSATKIAVPEKNGWYDFEPYKTYRIKKSNWSKENNFKFYITADITIEFPVGNVNTEGLIDPIDDTLPAYVAASYGNIHTFTMLGNIPREDGSGRYDFCYEMDGTRYIRTFAAASEDLRFKLHHQGDLLEVCVFNENAYIEMKALAENLENGEADGSLHQKIVEGKFPLEFTHPVTGESYSIGEEDVVGKYGAVFNGRSAARGVHSFAVNMKCVADGIHSVASGNYTVAGGSNSFAGGSETAADGFAAFATGNRTYAKGNHTFTSGNGTKALAQCSRAGGINTTASGDASAAEGHSTESSGLYSYSNGVGTKAKKRSQFSIGEYNADDANALFMVGNGSSDTDRSNAFSVQKDGSIKVGGKQFTPDMLGGGGGIKGYKWSTTFDDSCIMAYAHIYNSAWEISVEGLCIRRLSRYGVMVFDCHTACCEELPPVYPDWFKTSMGHIYLDASTGAFKSATAIFWNTSSKTFETEEMSTDPYILYLVKDRGGDN